jgi:hypothetical protein
MDEGGMGGDDDDSDMVDRGKCSEGTKREREREEKREVSRRVGEK